ncbi:DUF1702 family protein [Micromonospora sp. WMMD1082]|uniref:DUF1702 family protein n=1 Tax=Micromonospora sp. WMMD1082 TaxID=3016104 RepID=UPI002417C462|nr:DUF1702 family protein [Micromonospora sp. WMMD1082]MDG4793437.1 DUF1702 family protein [Micromonospora sp. WMMD1082]
MATTLGTLRRLALAPSLDEVSFRRRGFPAAPSAATRKLEAVPQAVVCGFEWGIEGSNLADLEHRLELVDPELRGFAYEGATMAYTVRDATGRRGRRTEELLRGPGQPHLFLAYIGIGFAMARLPRVLWRKVVPDLTGSPYHPTMSWLAVDGYGFDKAYFDTARYLDGQQQPAPYPWQGAPAYFPRAADQGVGRAIWFIHGAVVPDCVAAVERFAVERRADLWSGLGLAATFAGGADAAALAGLRAAAGAYAPDLAQGAAFAAKARAWSGYVPEHSEVAMRALGDCDVAAAAVIADEVAGALGEGDEVPAYERWRAAVRARFVLTRLPGS